MEVNANIVKELREKTGAGVMDCKKALAESGGDLEKADRLAAREGYRRGGQARAGRVASEGSVGSYIHAGGKLGVLIEVNCEDRFLAKSKFPGAGQGTRDADCGANPRCVRREELPPR